MGSFRPIPKKVHKPIRHKRKLTATPTSYKPKLRKLSNVREAKMTPHKRTFFIRKKKPVPKSPYRYKYKSESRINGVFVLLVLVLAVLVTGVVLLLKYLLD